MAQKVNVCGVQIDRYSFDETVTAIVQYASQPSPAPEYVVTPNAQHILLLQEDADLQETYRKAFLVVPDGASLLWAAKFLSTPLRGRVNGTNLFVQLCGAADKAGLRVFFLGGRPGAADGAAQVLRSKYPNLDIVGIHCPSYGFEKDTKELISISECIEATSPQLLFVGLGTPKQEKWIYANRHTLKVPISIGIGGGFDQVAGIVKRAPVWMQEAGLEWLFRLLIEPHRLWRRYILGNPRFVWLVLKQRLGLLDH